MINVNTGFAAGSKDAIDARIVLTKEQMLNINENTQPDVYIAACLDDGQLYVYNKDNDIDEETGKFRVVEGGGGDLSNYISYTSEAFETLSTHTYEIDEYTQDEVDAMFSETAEELAELSAIIADSLKSKFKLWSSQKVADEIAAAVIESNAYADGLIGEISSISLEVVQSLPAQGASNIIYILQLSDKNTLNVYSNGAWVEVGNLNVDFSDYYNKTKVDELLAAKADADNVVSADNVKQDLSDPNGDDVLSTFGVNKIISDINNSLVDKADKKDLGTVPVNYYMKNRYSSCSFEDALNAESENIMKYEHWGFVCETTVTGLPTNCQGWLMVSSCRVFNDIIFTCQETWAPYKKYQFQWVRGSNGKYTNAGWQELVTMDKIGGCGIVSGTSTVTTNETGAFNLMHGAKMANAVTIIQPAINANYKFICSPLGVNNTYAVVQTLNGDLVTNTTLKVNWVVIGK